MHENKKLITVTYFCAKCIKYCVLFYFALILNGFTIFR
jgi:hypothetical protein